MAILQKVIDTTLLAVQEAAHVFIDEARARNLAARLAEGVPPPPWHGPEHFFDGTENTVQWIFVLDTINHCFWAPGGATRWTFDYLGSRLDGYAALAASLKVALINGKPVLDAGFLSRLTARGLGEILGGEGELLLMEERAASLREAGRVLLAEYGGSFKNVVDAAGGSVQALVEILVRDFPSFRDAAFYRGREIFFLKRAQLLAADLFSAFRGEGYGRFHDTESLTAFADYKLPQVLREMGVLVYSEDLAEKVDNLEELAPGAGKEVEIRAATVIAVEKMRESLPGASAMELDHRLWRAGQEKEFLKRPYHRTRTIFY